MGTVDTLLTRHDKGTLRPHGVNTPVSSRNSLHRGNLRGSPHTAKSWNNTENRIEANDFVRTVYGQRSCTSQRHPSRRSRDRDRLKPAGTRSQRPLALDTVRGPAKGRGSGPPKSRASCVRSQTVGSARPGTPTTPEQSREGSSVRTEILSDPARLGNAHRPAPPRPPRSGPPPAPPGAPDDPDDAALAAFRRLLDAVAWNDFAEARRQRLVLRRLGWSVLSIGSKGGDPR